MDDVAIVDDVDALRQRERRGEVLLHQHDGLAGLGQIAAGLHQVAHDHRRQPSNGSSSRMIFGSRTSARAIASICCSPPDRSVPRLPRRSLQPREHLVDAVERPALRGGQPGDHEVLLDAQAAEDAALLMDQLHAGLCDLVALLAGDIDAVEHHRAAARRHHAHQALQRRALAGAVAAEQRHHLVALDAQRDVEQDVGIP